MRTRLACLLISTLACGAAACSSSATTDDGGPDARPVTDGGSSETGGTDAGIDVPAPTDVAPDAPVPADAPIIPSSGGQVTASVFGLMGFAQSVGAAGFYEIMGTNPSSNCRQRVTGACTIIDCRPSSGGDGGVSDGGTTTRASNAGNITIAGGMGAPMVLMPGANGAYNPVTEMNMKWSAGDMLTFTAAGAEVPAFTGTLTFPTPVTVTSPMQASLFTPIPVDRAMGLTATWTPGTGGVTVFIGQGGAGGTGAINNGVLINCAFDSATGTGTVPPAAMTELTPSMGAFPDAFLAVTARASTEVVAGAFRVTLNATGGGLVGAAQIR